MARRVLANDLHFHIANRLQLCNCSPQDIGEVVTGG